MALVLEDRQSLDIALDIRTTTTTSLTDINNHVIAFRHLHNTIALGRRTTIVTSLSDVEQPR